MSITKLREVKPEDRRHINIESSIVTYDDCEWLTARMRERYGMAVWCDRTQIHVYGTGQGKTGPTLRVEHRHYAAGLLVKYMLQAHASFRLRLAFELLPDAAETVASTWLASLESMLILGGERAIADYLEGLTKVAFDPADMRFKLTVPPCILTRVHVRVELNTKRAVEALIMARYGATIEVQPVADFLSLGWEESKWGFVSFKSEEFLAITAAVLCENIAVYLQPTIVSRLPDYLGLDSVFRLGGREALKSLVMSLIRTGDGNDPRVPEVL